MIIATRYHDISCGHRVVGHESKCKYLHGHNYRIHFHCSANKLDAIGRVIDFQEIKIKLCDWLEERWDHKFLIWVNDPLLDEFVNGPFWSSIVTLPFNPTAENMAKYLGEIVAKDQLKDSGIEVVRVIVEETRKCSAKWEK